jgi:hypothetical protein
MRTLQVGLMLAVIVLVAGSPAPAGDKGELTGTWKWTTEFGGQTRQNTLKLKLDGSNLTGAYIGRDDKETPIEDAKFKDGEVSFKVTRERQGQKFTTKYQGKLSGDTIKGSAESDFGGEVRKREWEAKRAAK